VITAVPVAVPSCSTSYLGESNGICTYQTATVPNCTALNRFGQSPALSISPLGCDGTGNCQFSLPVAPGNNQVASPPTRYAEAITYLNQLKIKLTELNGSNEVGDGRRLLIERFVQYTNLYDTWMKNPIAGTEAVRLAEFLKGNTLPVRTGFMQEL